MKKRNKALKIILLVCVLVLSNVFTFKFASIYGAVSGNKISKIKFLEDYVKNNYLYDVTDKELEIGELKGVVAGLNDPYSEYFTKEEYEELTKNISGKFYGIGVVISAQDGDLITVVSPIKDSPADRAGIKAGDKIVKVNDKEYSSAQINEAMQVMRGNKGESVKITVYRPSDSKTYDFNIKRDEVKAETIISKDLNGIGYIGITQFSEDTAKDFKKALLNLEKENIKGLIIDLRGNPGGIVDTSAEIADELLPEGVVVYAKNRDHKKVFEFKSDAKHTELPLVVLINEGSASASEILAGAIRDYNRGKIVGMKSFGKGIVQTVVRFPSGDGIKLTTSEYFSPKGINIHKKGIEPDIKVELPKDIKGIGIEHLNEDTQLQKAIEILNNEIK